METIQYSLKNNTDYSIDIRLALKYSQAKQRQRDKNFIQNSLVIEETKTAEYTEQSEYNFSSKNTNNNYRDEDDKNAIFDKPCLDIYGNRTCILFEISKDVFQLRFLDKNRNKMVNRTEFYIQIPTLVEKLYTVIVVEKIENLNMEIVAIHSPPNNTSTVNNIITPSLN